LIATDLLSRGFDLQTLKLVINFDVPSKQSLPEYETYMHRIGRTGRFGSSGIALTLIDREEDEKIFFDIIAHY
jgi:ATP-dependent RNA helicase DDX19/DBP5